MRSEHTEEKKKNGNRRQTDVLCIRIYKYMYMHLCMYVYVTLPRSLVALPAFNMFSSPSKATVTTLMSVT
jgi:hypothetical protein